MSKPRLTALAQALKLVDTLNEGDRATLRDYLKPTATPRSKSPTPAPRARRQSSVSGVKGSGGVSSGIEQDAVSSVGAGGD